jgi:hypothetical protein
MRRGSFTHYSLGRCILTLPRAAGSDQQCTATIQGYRAAGVERGPIRSRNRAVDSCLSLIAWLILRIWMLASAAAQTKQVTLQVILASLAVFA